MVEAREVRGPLQLPLLRQRAAAVRQCRGGSGEARRQEGLPLREQPFLREVGCQRRDSQTPARSGRGRRLHGGNARALPGAEGHRQETGKVQEVKWPLTSITV